MDSVAYRAAISTKTSNLNLLHCYISDIDGSAFKKLILKEENKYQPLLSNYQNRRETDLKVRYIDQGKVFWTKTFCSDT